MSRIDGREFARSRGRLSGRLLAHDTPRLKELGWQPTTEVEFTLQGRSDAHGRLYLDLEVAATLATTCQRCMQVLEYPLRFVRALELAASLEAIEEADDDIDRVLAGPAMAVNELVEDEMILELPMVGRHERCQAMAPEQGGSAAQRDSGAGAAFKDKLQEWARRSGSRDERVDQDEPQTARRGTGGAGKPMKEQ